MLAAGSGAGRIGRHSALCHPGECRRCGLAHQRIATVTLEKQVEGALERFEAAVASRPEVMECYLMTGDFDYLIRVITPDLQAYQAFLDQKLTALEGIEHIKSSFSLKPICYKTELPLGHLI